ncbi:hypothetical protein NLJ89_g5910 [Agrocybe chaxingu]|uniref:Uncharacterized protein n=1 Tax=Agrocybe chaxingu TaxID=84603 RepID=A0A9W8MT75_9AGAR|nr:hypothetical protein NLJ89_g5910 [Agrocybe chaxingu]
MKRRGQSAAAHDNPDACTKDANRSISEESTPDHGTHHHRPHIQAYTMTDSPDTPDATHPLSSQELEAGLIYARRLAPPGYDQPQQGYYGQGQQAHSQGQGYGPTPSHAHSHSQSHSYAPSQSYSPPPAVPPQQQYGQPNLGYPQQHQPHSRPTSVVYGQPVPTPGFPVPQGGPPSMQGQYNVPVPGPGAYAAQAQQAQANLASQYKGYAEPMRGLPPK